ncbi:MAG: FtsB family cell division protein [Ferruginibacter sp.]
MQYIHPILKVLKNKYVIASVSFLVWMFFFDPKDWGLITARNIKLSELKHSEKQLSLLIKDTRKELSLLKTDAASIEKYAREKFFMKKDNEDLFIVKLPE